MRYPAPIGYLLACVTLLGAATPALSAQLYKWVDERGVTNYSNQPPTDPNTARNLRPVEGNLSVYSPDPALARAVATYRQESYKRGLAERVDYLERELAAERLARQYAPPAAALSVPCQSGDCYGNYPAYYPGGIAGGGFFPVGHKRLIPAQLPVGATAGNVVGMSGFIP
ncbi:MAG: DUF4124 domain-containing protein, partial [Burkholderiales bacterium]